MEGFLDVVNMFPRRPKTVRVRNSAARRPKTEQGGIVCRPCWTTKRKSWPRDVPKMFTRRLETVYVGSSVGPAQRSSERSERSERSDLDGRGDLPSESCSKDAFRVREGRIRKAIQHAYVRQTCLVWLAPVPARFHLQRASRSYVNTRFIKNAPGITFSIVLGLPRVAS